MNNPFKMDDKVIVQYRGYPTLTFKATYKILNTSGDWCWVMDDEGSSYRVRYPLFRPE